MKLNGKTFTISENTNLLDFLKNNNYREDRVAVELNGNIVSKEKFKETILKNEDDIEIVCFVGGG